MSKLTDQEKVLLRDLQKVLKKHNATLGIDESDLAIRIFDSIGCVERGLFICDLSGHSIDAESFTQADIDGETE